MTISDMDVIEINEAFASVAIISSGRLGIDPDTINPNGGAIALGHPIGASGARLVLTLAYELKRRGGGYRSGGDLLGRRAGRRDHHSSRLGTEKRGR